MKITFLGTGVAIPTAERVQSGILIDDKFPILFDCGGGILHRIAQAGYNHSDIDTVFFTHHHLDHDSDFIALVKANWLRNKNEINIYGRIGTKKWFEDTLEVYPYLKDKIVFNVKELKDGSKFDFQGYKIEVRDVVHSLPCLGYKIENEDYSIVISGDTEPCEGLRDLCNDGVDLLIHECSFPNGFNVTNHTTPNTLAKWLKGLDVKKVILTHLYPETIGHEKEIVETVKSNFNGEVQIAHDLLTILV